MQLLVNDQPCPIAVTPESTLRDLAQAVCSADPSSRCLVVSVHCDGQSVPNDRLESALDTPAAAFHEVALHTQPLKALVIQSLRDAALLLDSIDAARSEAADLIAQGHQQPAFQVLGKLFAEWRQVQETFALCSAAMHPQGSHSGSCAADPHAPLMEHMRQQLIELKAALQAADLVLVGDILSFELPEHFKRWRETLEALRKDASKR